MLIDPSMSEVKIIELVTPQKQRTGGHQEQQQLMDKQNLMMTSGGSDEDENQFRDSIVSSTGGSCNKKRHRRGKSKKKRSKWKPYYKLSWQERREIDDRETERANNVRQSMFANGQPVAPYNTTQFLMQDHELDRLGPNLNKSNNLDTRLLDPKVLVADNGHQQDEFYSSPEDEEDFLQRQFSEAYENVHAERLNAMSKADLVQEYMLLEEKVESLEAELKEVKTNDKVKRLTEENERLKCENQLLRTIDAPPP